VACVTIQLLVQHSNVNYAVGPLRRVLAANQVHRFHHLKWSGLGDVNFGLFTNLWDHMLRTAVWDPNQQFSSEMIGIAAEPDFPVRYVEQLMKPFRRSADRATTAQARAVSTSRSSDPPYFTPTAVTEVLQ
jgi:sterol desaturase/sphingolipid hydroxylase (fatty acid hydroxylase superfamily)